MSTSPFLPLLSEVSLLSSSVSLFLSNGQVYFAEYAMQSGVWSAIGFPMDSEDARKRFYTFANWTYQVRLSHLNSNLKKGLNRRWTIRCIALP